VRLAAIDLGTNTVRLLTVDAETGVGWRTLDEGQRVTRLGEGLARTGRLSDAAMGRTAETVAEYASRAARAGAERVWIVGTSAMREARNGAAFAAALESLTGHPVRILAGGEEARLTLAGVLHGLPSLAGAVVVFDIGGGSTEFIRARAGAVESAVSLRLGVVRLAEDGGPAAGLAQRLRERIRQELPPTIRGAGVDQLVGTAGTVTTLAALDQGLTVYDPARVHGHTLTRQAVERQQDRLAPLSVAEIGELPCLEPGRADLIRPGIAATLAVMDVLGVLSLVVSEYGLREGVLADALGLGGRIRGTREQA
jgi:exopolyphosphatase / guanosine-5'-triphosphate,3'-diphosphate pyrophosphatase